MLDVSLANSPGDSVVECFSFHFTVLARRLANIFLMAP